MNQPLERLTSGYREFWRSTHTHYPEEMKPGGLLDQGMYDVVANAATAKSSGSRFVKPSQRIGRTFMNAWVFPVDSTKIVGALALTYKGLINVKTPFDLSLYTRLIWELQPRSIIELGTFQGGSALWLADQMSVLCKEPGEVHTFDCHTECVSPAAQHELLTFHSIDLKDPNNFDPSFLDNLAHPWIVIDDAHVNVFDVHEYLNNWLADGDYYIIEDIPMEVNRQLLEGMDRVERLGYYVDTFYTDAFAPNLTTAPNAWLRKFDS